MVTRDQTVALCAVEKTIESVRTTYPPDQRAVPRTRKETLEGTDPTTCSEMSKRQTSSKEDMNVAKGCLKRVLQHKLSADKTELGLRTCWDSDYQQKGKRRSGEREHYVAGENVNVGSYRKKVSDSLKVLIVELP